MKAFIATSLRNKVEALQIIDVLNKLSIEHQCCITEEGSLEGAELFRHNYNGIADSDIFISVLKTIGRDVSTEIGMAHALGKKRIGIVYDMNPEDVMPYFAAGDLIHEKDLESKLKSLFGPEKITLFDFKQHSMSNFIKGLNPIFESHYFVEGFNVKALEVKLSEYFQRPALVAGSGTSALMMALDVILSKDKNEVIVPSLTFPATIQAITHTGGIPLFVDVDQDSWTIDTNDVKRRISKKTAAILPVHLFGNPADINTLQDISERTGVPIIYDSCQAFGAYTPHGTIGSFGDIEVFSLDITKALSSVLGGFVSVRDSSLIPNIVRAKNYGNNPEKLTLQQGINGRMSEFHALLALESLVTVKERLKTMRRNANKYEQALSNIEGIRLQKQCYGTQSPQVFSVLVDGPYETVNAVKMRLIDRGIETRVFNPLLLHEKGLFTDNVDKLKVTESMCAKILCLPTHQYVKDQHIQKIHDVLKEVLL